MKDREFLGIKPNFNDKMGFTMDLSVEKYEKDEETGRTVKKQFKKSAGSFIEKPKDTEKAPEPKKPQEFQKPLETVKPNVSRFNPLYNKPPEPKNTEESGETVIFKDPKGF